MNKLTLINDRKYEIGIDQYKYMINVNNGKTYQLIQILRQYFNKENISEYQEESHIDNKVLFNEQLINLKNYEYIELGIYRNLQDDLTLNTKSLLTKYLEVLLKDIEYSDTFNTLKILFEELETDVNALLEEEQINQLYFKLNDMNKKLLIKLTELFFKQDELLSNSYSLDYEESILFQLKIIHNITMKVHTKHYIISLFLYDITPKIQAKLDTLNKNVTMLIFSNRVSSIHSYIISKSCFDLENDQALHDTILIHLSFFISIEELRKEILYLLMNPTSTTKYSQELIKYL